MSKRIVVIGSSFAGFATALELRKRIDSANEIIVVSTGGDFLFLPSLIWVPFGHRKREDVSFPLAKAYEREGIRFVQGRVEAIRAESSAIDLEDGPIPYDYLVVATGGAPDWDHVPGLGPDSNVQSIGTWDAAEKALVAWEHFLLNPGPVVIGGTQGSASMGLSYEFALNVAHELRKAGARGRVEQTFITPEPFLGHLGVHGMGIVGERIGTMFKELGIEARTDATVARVDPDKVVLEDGRELPYAFAMITPQVKGAQVVADSDLPISASGFVLVTPELRCAQFPRVFAAGVAAELPVEAKAAPRRVGLPKTGYLAEQMGRVVAANIAADMVGDPLDALTVDEIDGKFIIDAGDDGLIVSTDKMVNPGEDAWVLPGREAHWAKLALEKYFLATRSRGRV